MTQNPHNRFSRLPAVIALSLLVALTVSTAPADAGERRGGGGHHDQGRHGGGRDHRYRNGYYPPPVVYGTPYYEPPPVVYGPAIGIALPGINIGIH